MTRLIDRADLFNRLATVQTLAEAFAVIQGMPEAEPKRGFWIWDAYKDSTACSACGHLTLIEYDYFPSCGAYMKAKTDPGG